MLQNIVDGWLLNPSIRYLPYQATPLQLGQMDALRRAHNLRDRQLVFPNQVTDAIPAYGQYNREAQITPGSYLFAMAFWEFAAATPPAVIGAPIPPLDFSLQVTDEQSGVEIHSEFISANVWYPNTGNARLRMPYVLLMQPHIFEGKGLLSVRIANQDASPHNCQLVMRFLEPCSDTVELDQCAGPGGGR